jgi:hypothetical protein
MSERDPYDFSALANDPDFGDDSTSVLGPEHDPAIAQQFVPSEEADIDFELEFEAMVGEESLAGPLAESNEQLRQFQAVLQRLGDSLVDPQLEAEEAWLEAMLLEDGSSEAGGTDFLEQLRGGLSGGRPDVESLFGETAEMLDDL